MLDLMSIFSGVFLLFLSCAICCCCLRFAVWACYELWQPREDRQNNVELGRQHNRFGDIFYIEPNSQEAARIREQLEKDDKELPSYDEVMRMCNLTTPTAAAALPTPTMESSAIGIAALPAPPYSECDPHLNVETPAATNAVTASTLEPSPSTSRAAQIPT
ncbi:uncharacterized protein [Drosophila virilis]|uniref:Uncharacterized protein, isoform O n=1 Tax=Drosophila virilis TaxID=7244 RepID=A0A0Q9WFD7_DROVI|nr:uncharacterized protein LOC6625339 isoform X12 [Drosophila virilis]KRF80116.1 uncharacterized protein Dvir_GJ20211, isoform O [Drosophila virilis]